MKTNILWYRFISKLLIYLMIIQGFFYWPLSELYSRQYKPERAQRIIEFIGSALSPSDALAAPPRVVCVPQVPTDLLVPHDTWLGESVILKGIARDADDNLSGGTYYWDFGDGTQSAVQSISNADNLSSTHTYTDDAGTLIIARLYVTDAAGETDSDEYRILIKAKTLDVEVNKAIDDGLWWLYTNKLTSGAYFRWRNYPSGSFTGYYNNPTASAVQAFEINGHLESGDRDENPYVDAVSKGLGYLFSRIRTYNIGDTTYGDPDVNGNGIGLTVTENRQIYELGAVMDALVATGTPDAIAPNGQANVVGRRYQDIVQDMCDMYAWGQTNGGGWQYNWNSGNDNSASQWGAIGMIAAERHFGCTVPQWVKERNLVWLNNSYNSAGYFGYTSRSAHRNGYATGPSGMVQMAFDGIGSSNSRWQACERYMEDRWSDFIRSNRDMRYYSYYPLAKALRLAVPNEVTHLPSGLDWYGDETRGLARILVDRQNSGGNWPYDGWPYVGQPTAAAWNIIVLTRTLFEKPPVALIHAEPNPGAVGQAIQLDASDSYHVDPAKEIVKYVWDFDASDGVDFDHPDAEGISTTVTYGALGTYQVSLRVIDNSDPARFDVGNLDINITIPPHPPTAVVGGPYIAAVGEDVQLDGSYSYDIDESEGDGIMAWDWEINFETPYDYAEAHEEIVTIPGFSTLGHHDIALRVTDNTAVVFPTSGSPNLTHAAFGRVTVFKTNITDLAARPKATKCQLTWTHVDASVYEVLRSETGPNQGFEMIGTTDSTYSTYIDYNVVMYRDYWYRIRSDVDGETLLSGAVHVNSQGRIRNQPPEITSTAITTAQEGLPYSYDVEATDPEGTALTYYLDQAPDGMAIDAASGLITWAPTFEQVGVVDVTVRVKDAARASDAQFFQVVVQPRPNTSPIAVPGGPYDSLINTSVAFDASGSSDPEGDAISLFHWIFGDGTEGYGEQISHAYTAAGLYTVTLYIIDDRGATASAETTCQVETPNRVPIANAGGPYAGEVGIPVNFDGSQSYDADDDDLTLIWNFGDSTPAGTGVQVSHTFTQEGTYQVSLSVDDGRGGLDTDTIEIIVAPPNQPPVADFSVDDRQEKWTEIIFDASLSYDPEGRPLSSWTWDFGDGVTTTGTIASHVYGLEGEYEVVLQVTDDHGAIGEKRQTITITHPEPNNPPVIDAGGPYSGPMGSEIQLTATGGDTEGDDITYSWTFDGQTQVGQTVSFLFSQEGTFQIELTGDDGFGGIAVDTAIVNVYDPNAPVDQVPPDVSFGDSIQPGQTFSGTVTFEGTVDDENLASWTFEYAPSGSNQWTQIASGTDPVIDGELGTLNTTSILDDVYIFRLTVCDNNQCISSFMEANVSNPFKLGRFTLTYTDTSLPLKSMRINLNRTYNTERRGHSDDFGHGWTLDIKTTDIREDSNHNVYITLPDGERVSFAFTPVRISPWFPFYYARYTAPAGVSDELMINEEPLLVISGGQWFYFLDSRGYYDPDVYILKRKDGTTYTISQQDGVRQVEDRNGTYYSITDDGILTNTGKNIDFTRDTSGRITTITDFNGNQVHYSYDGQGDLVNVVDQLGNISSYTYDAEHYMTDIVDPGNCSPLRNEYDSDGRISAKVDNKGNRTTYTYDDVNRAELITDPIGRTTSYFYDERGNTIMITDPLGLTTEWTYDANDNKTSVSYPSGRAIAYTYDNFGNKLSESHEIETGKTVTYAYTYNSYGQPLTVTQPFGNQVVYTYDAKGSLIKREAKDADGNTLQTESATFDASGQITSLTASKGTVTFGYDSQGNMTIFTDGAGGTTLLEYDDNGNRTTKIDPLGNRTEYDYNGFNKVTALRQNGEFAASIQYNHFTEIASITDAIGQTTSFEYDCMGHQTAVIDPAGVRTEYEYGATGKLSAVIGGNGNRAEFQYDALDRQIGRTDADGGSIAFTYNLDGIISGKTTAAGDVIEESYDGLNRLIYRSTPERRVSYVLNDNSYPQQITETRDGVDYITRMTTDGIGNITTVTDPKERSVGYSYDSFGRITSLTAPDNTVTTYIYDNAGRVDRIQTGSDWVDYDYDAAGRRTSMTFSNGVSTAITYNSDNRLVSLVTTGPEGIIYDEGFTYDAEGNPTSHDQNGVTATLDYDLRDFITSEQTSSGTQSFTYDTTGNRLDPGLSFGPANRILNDSLVGDYTYDANGNVTARGSEDFVYDSENRLVQYDNGPMSAVYGYDFDGRRISKKLNGQTTEYVYSEDEVLAEYQDDIMTARYTFGPRGNEPVMVVRNGDTYFYHADGEGNIIAITNADGQAVQQYAYNTWGVMISSSGIFTFNGSGLVNTFTYNGKPFDAESGLYHFKARAYDPSNGRFMQKDPQQGLMRDPRTFNPYIFALNNPLRFDDPTGEIAAVSYGLLLGTPTHFAMGGALIGFMHGFGGTNLVFIGEFLGLVPMQNGQDISSVWDIALERTEARMKEITKVLEKMAGASGSVAGDQFGVLGLVGGFVSGAGFKVGFKVEVSGFGLQHDFGPNISFGEAGGFKNGVKEGLSYLRSLRP